LLVKSSLEDIVANKWTQDLSTIIDEKDFKLSIDFDLKEKKNKNGEYELKGPLYNDLDLGFLDAEELLKSYKAQNFDLDRGQEFLVSKAAVKVGLAPSLSENKIKIAKEFLNAKIKSNFGKNGSLNVSNFENIESSPFKEPTMLEKLQKFQVIGGSLLLALALVLGSILFGLSSKTKDQASSPSDLSASVNVNSKSEISGGDRDSNGGVAAAASLLSSDIADYRKRIKEISETLSDELESIVAEWCKQGENGFEKLACFTEVASSVVGKVVIPEEFKGNISKLFSSMHKLDEKQKLELFEQTYWDLVASSNLGVSSLHEPFSFMANASLDTLNTVLSNDDSRNQAIISMYMPQSSRESYFKDLDQDKKLEILTTAARLSSVTENELHQLEDHYAKHFDNQVDESDISMSQTLKKIVDALSLIDACKMLPNVQGQVMENYKSSFGHVAFLSQWSDASLSYLMKRSTSEEIFAYIKVVPHMKDTLLSLTSPKTSEIVLDDLNNSADTFNEKVIKENLKSLNNKILDIFSNDELKIAETIVKEENNDIKIAA